jgi:hypothetical protein
MNIDYLEYVMPWKSCGYLTGKITASFNASLAWSKPTTSANVTLGSVTIAPTVENQRSYLC